MRNAPFLKQKTMYYNTTQSKGNELKEYKGKALNQDEKLLEHFKININDSYSASELWLNLFETTHTPLTSIRRSLNTLKESNLITKLSEQKIGIYGRPEYLWKLTIEDKQLNLF